MQFPLDAFRVVGAAEGKLMHETRKPCREAEILSAPFSGACSAAQDGMIRILYIEEQKTSTTYVEAYTFHESQCSCVCVCLKMSATTAFLQNIFQRNGGAPATGATKR